MTRPPSKSGEADRAHVAALRLVDQFQRALGRRDRGEIVERIHDLVSAKVPLAGQWQQLALMAVDLGEIGLARRAADLYVESFGGTDQARFDTIPILARFGAYDEVLALLRSLPATVPDRYTYALSRGAAAVNVGEPEEALAWLREALRLRPQSGPAWHSLAQLIDFGDDPVLADRLIAAEGGIQGSPAGDRAQYYYARGKAHSDRAEHAQAFAAVARGASETRALYPNDRSLERQLANEATRGFDAGRIAAIARQQTEPTGRTIFVMGLPRSGTTLLEQIVTSHSEVSQGGEIDLLRLLVHEAGDASGPAVENLVKRTGAPTLARFWQHLLDERFAGSSRIVDKTTDNTRKLGLAASLLPDAPLIWLTRDPLDCAWSCFRHYFMRGIRWSNDLTDIAFNFRLDDRLLSQWRDILGERLLVVPYEELVTEPDAGIRRILSHCDLAVEPQAFAPHRNKRTVNTASVAQVRRPINRDAIGSAEPYRAFLKPFVEAYRA